MNGAPHPYTVVVGVDYREHSELVLNTALDVAAERQDSVVHVVYVLPGPHSFVEQEPGGGRDGKLVALANSAECLKHYVALILEKRALANRNNPARIVTHALLESEAHQIAQLASDVEADLAVIGASGRRGILRLLFDPISETTLRLAPCPVLLVRPKAPPAPLPTLDPPCPRCREIRQATNASAWFCDEHRDRHGLWHAHHHTDRGADGLLPLSASR